MIAANFYQILAYVRRTPTHQRQPLTIFQIIALIDLSYKECFTNTLMAYCMEYSIKKQYEITKWFILLLLC